MWAFKAFYDNVSTGKGITRIFRFDDEELGLDTLRDVYLYAASEAVNAREIMENLISVSFLSHDH